MRHPGLGDGIDRGVGAALEGRDRADGDDASLTPRHHLLGHGLTGQDRRQQVAIQHGADILFADADGIVRIGLAAFGGDVAAGIVDQNIDRSQRLRGGLDHPRDVGAKCEIAENADGAHAMRRRHLFRDRGQRRSLAVFSRAVLAHAMDRDIGAETGEPFGEGPAESAACAGDQCNLAREWPRGVV